MASYPLGSVPLAGNIGTTDQADTFPTHLAELGKGGHRTVTTITNRNNITLDRREWGQLVTVSNDLTPANNGTYQLRNVILGGINDTISDNANWIFVNGLGNTTSSIISASNGLSYSASNVTLGGSLIQPTIITDSQLGALKKGIKLNGFGESNSDTGLGADYSTLVGTSLVPKKWVEDTLTAFGNIYTLNGTLTSARTVTQGALPLTLFQGTSGSKLILTESLSFVDVDASSLLEIASSTDRAKIRISGFSDDASAANINYYKSRGSIAVPADSLAGDDTVRISGRNRLGNAWVLTGSIVITANSLTGNIPTGKFDVNLSDHVGNSSAVLRIIKQSAITAGSYIAMQLTGFTFNPTSGTAGGQGLHIGGTFNPTGTANNSIALLNIRSTINQTSVDATIRGVHISPTITAVSGGGNYTGLEIDNSGLSNAHPHIKLVNVSTPTGSILTLNGLDLQINNKTASSIEFLTNNTFAGLINSSGNWGIGISTPSSKLSISGTSSDTGGLRILDNAGTPLNRLSIFSEGASSAALKLGQIGGSLNIQNSIGTKIIDISSVIGSENLIFVNGMDLIWKDSGAVNRTILTYDGSNNILLSNANASGNIFLSTNSITRLSINSSGVITLSNLAGTGDRLVQASATGVLSTTSFSITDIPLANLESIGANTIIGNATVALANPTAIGVSPNSFLGRISSLNSGDLTNIPIISSYITDLTDISSLTNPSNWLSDNSYNSTIATSVQGQKYNDPIWYYQMINDITPIRINKISPLLLSLKTPVTHTIVAETFLGGVISTNCIGTNTIIQSSLNLGHNFLIKASGILSSNSLNTLTFRIYFGAQMTSVIVPVSGTLDQSWNLEFSFTITALGDILLGKGIGQGWVMINSGIYPIKMLLETAIDTDINNDIRISTQWGSATSNSITMTNWTITQGVL